MTNKKEKQKETINTQRLKKGTLLLMMVCHFSLNRETASYRFNNRLLQTTLWNGCLGSIGWLWKASSACIAELWLDFFRWDMLRIRMRLFSRNLFKFWKPNRVPRWKVLENDFSWWVAMNQNLPCNNILFCFVYLRVHPLKARLKLIAFTNEYYMNKPFRLYACMYRCMCSCESLLWGKTV